MYHSCAYIPLRTFVIHGSKGRAGRNQLVAAGIFSSSSTEQLFRSSIHLFHAISLSLSLALFFTLYTLLHSTSFEFVPWTIRHFSFFPCTALLNFHFSICAFHDFSIWLFHPPALWLAFSSLFQNFCFNNSFSLSIIFFFFLFEFALWCVTVSTFLVSCPVGTFLFSPSKGILPLCLAF